MFISPIASVSLLQSVVLPDADPLVMLINSYFAWQCYLYPQTPTKIGHILDSSTCRLEVGVKGDAMYGLSSIIPQFLRNCSRDRQI